MKLTIVCIGMILTATGFAATTKARMPATTTTTTTVTTPAAMETTNRSSMSAPAFYTAQAEPKMHFSTNMLSLINGKPNVNANFFVTPQAALSVTFVNESEKTSPIKKLTPPSTQKFTVSTTQFGVGGAYYFYPMQQKWNISVNPYLLTEKRTDPLDAENNLGFGLKADSMFLLNSLALGAGVQTTSVAGDTTTIVNAGVGYIF